MDRAISFKLHFNNINIKINCIWNHTSYIRRRMYPMSSKRGTSFLLYSIIPIKFEVLNALDFRVWRRETLSRYKFCNFFGLLSLLLAFNAKTHPTRMERSRKVCNINMILLIHLDFMNLLFIWYIIKLKSPQNKYRIYILNLFKISS